MPGGRPTEYDESCVAVAREMARIGATEFEIARALEVSTVTIWTWKKKHPEFLNALKIGKDEADDRVEYSLYSRAVGYSYEAEKIFQSEGQIIRADYIEHCPPDTVAAFIWLQNRRPDKWKRNRDGPEVDPSGEKPAIRVHGGLPIKPTDDP